MAMLLRTLACTLVKNCLQRERGREGGREGEREREREPPPPLHCYSPRDDHARKLPQGLLGHCYHFRPAGLLRNGVTVLSSSTLATGGPGDQVNTKQSDDLSLHCNYESQCPESNRVAQCLQDHSYVTP